MLADATAVTVPAPAAYPPMLAHATTTTHLAPGALLTMLADATTTTFFASAAHPPMLATCFASDRATPLVVALYPLRKGCMSSTCSTFLTAGLSMWCHHRESARANGKHVQMTGDPVGWGFVEVSRPLGGRYRTATA